jgi:hypothetical protein
MTKRAPFRYWVYELENVTRGERLIFPRNKRLAGVAARRRLALPSGWRRQDRLELRILGLVPADYLASFLTRYAAHLRRAKLKVSLAPAPPAQGPDTPS